MDSPQNMNSSSWLPLASKLMIWFDRDWRKLQKRLMDNNGAENRQMQEEGGKK
jgi:hypothetical protein